MSVLHAPDAATAWTAWLDALRRAGGLEPLATEIVPVEQAGGRTVAAAIVATPAAPGYDAAAMDGVALAAADATDAPVTLGPGRFAHVDTGDPLPPGTDAVVKQEDLEPGEGARLGMRVMPFAHVRQLGEDVAAGDLLIRPGRRLAPADLAVLASVGETAVPVRRRPVVAIVPSGDELVPPGSDPGPGQIVDTNSLMLAAAAEEAGAAVLRHAIVPDDPDRLAEAIVAAAAGADLVLLLSGSARGADDHTVPVIERVGELVVQGVAIRPGHPVALGRIGPTPLIGVPGYPVSAGIAFDLFGVRMLAELEGGDAAERSRVRATAAAAMPSTLQNAEWIRLRLARVGGELLALPLRRGAGVLTSLARADGLACIPLGSDGVAAGETLDVELLRPTAAIERTLLVAGSTDPVLHELAAVVDVAVDCQGSLAGARQLAAGRCHVALLERCDVPEDAFVLAAWEREVGLAVAPGDPLGIDGVEALRRPGVRIVNRPQGSSSRRLLDALLQRHGIEPAAVRGFAREARSHNAAAAAVAGGVADCALVTSAAAELHGLRFVPLARQRVELATTRALACDPRVAQLQAAAGRRASG